MSRFHLELTGNVGKDNFNAQKTVALLNQYPGKHVDVLIDSTGGSLAHGLSIADAFRAHGDVTAHMRGMCASAATIASMGAKKISIAPDAFYLVHQVMMSFFDWSMHNADSLQQYIDALEKQKQDLLTLDASVAQTYAQRCKKPVNELLSLMKEGKWLSAKEALDWGFVDEILNELPSENKLTQAQAAMFEAQGLPVPPVEILSAPSDNSLLNNIVSSIKSLFNMQNDNKDPKVSDPDSLSAQSKEVEDIKAQLVAEKAKYEELKAKYEKLAKEPGDSSLQSFEQNQSPKNEDDNEFAQLMKVNKEAKALFDALP